MENNTSLNPKILLAELAVYKLQHAFKARLPIRFTLSRAEIETHLKKMASAVQVLKYSYLGSDDLIKHEKTLEIQEDANILFDCVKNGYRPNKYQMGIHEATIYWACRLLKNLSVRLANTDLGTKIEAGLDSKVVGIRNIIPIEGTNLFLARVHDGEDDFSVVTNITTLKAGYKVAASFLPPAEFGGTVSEAMFLGDKQYEDDYGQPVLDAQFKDVRSLLKEEFTRMAKDKK
ncbi:MAG: hypothetical protein ACTSP4_07315 [Candidatus Hodarchaeales archaeon]